MVTREKLAALSLGWRWTDRRYCLLPESALHEISINSQERTQQLLSFAHACDERLEWRSWEDVTAIYFDTDTKMQGSEKLRAAAEALALAPDTACSAVWSGETEPLSLRMPWHLFEAYWDDFFYPASDTWDFLLDEKRTAAVFVLDEMLLVKKRA